MRISAEEPEDRVMHSSQAEVYSRTQVSALSDREAEAAVLMKAAAMMKHVQSHWTAPDRDLTLEKALRYNQRLWTFFQVALLDEKNPLPQHIRENVLRLSAFIDRRIFDTLAYPVPEKLDILININTNIAAGLKGIAV
jgi:flagellar biosynthesis activator protein FlaF